MSKSIDVPLTTKNNIKIQTYVFDEDGKSTPDYSGKKNILRILPPCCAYLISFCFGIMIGWSSPVFPKLVPTDSEIPITMDQTALIAGFLMIGNMFGVLPAHFLPCGTKYGIMLGLILMPIGWLVMWHASSIYGILTSRFLIGLGHGFGVHHGKEYIKEMAESPFKENLAKSAQIYIGFGTLVGFCYGPFVDFRTYSVISLLVTAVICVICIVLPHPPTELVKYNKIVQAKTLLRFIKPEIDATAEIDRIKLCIQEEIFDYGYDIVKSKRIRCNFIILMFLIFFQEFCGMPSTINFCMIVLEKMTLPNPGILAIVYVFVFLLGQAIGTFYSYRFNFKYVLLFSSTFTTALLMIVTMILHFELNIKWPYVSYIFLLLYNFFHSVGWGPLPFLLTSRLFSTAPIISHIQTIFFSIWVIVVTKLFQVLFTYHALHIGFLMFSVAGVFGTLFVLIFIPSNLTKLLAEKRNSNDVNNTSS